MDLENWLKTLGLEQYAAVFAENDVDLAALPHLTDADLRELGLSLGHRRKLLAALAGLKSGETTAEPEAKTEDQVERRQLTVLFCDLAGSTELAETLDPEELREVMRRYHEAVASEIASRDGHVAKLLGDGVLAYFGWPTAREAQTESAVHAAAAALRAVSRLEAAGRPLAARAGIATGPVVIGDMHGLSGHERGAVSGSAPNLAARLQALAEPGELMIDAATRRLVHRSFELEDAGMHRLKGFAEGVPAWRVRGAARTGSRFESMHGAGLTHMVGRAHETGMLTDRWQKAADGEGQLVVITGEAGIGKSRVLLEFVGSLDAPATRTLRFQCSPHEVNTAFHPLLAEIETAAGFQADDPPERRLDLLEAHLAQVFDEPTEAATLIGQLLSLPVDRYPPLDMAPQRRKQRTVTLLAERILRLAESAPVVLLIEDMHWIDPSSLEVLDALVPRLEDHAVLAVVTCRPEFRPPWLGLGYVTALSLNRLGRREGRAIAQRIAGGKALPDAVLDRIVEQTDGVPLFVEELTKAVLESGVLEEREDGYVVTGSLPALEIPTSLQDSLMARLDRLAPVKRVIQAAACIGREFRTGLLRAALGMEAEELDKALAQLQAAELVFPRGGYDEPRYIFKHALVQDAAYSSLLLSNRRALHQRLAMALEAGDEPEPLELARHFRGAGANERAAECYLAAGRRALEASALPEAIGALELGLEAVGDLPPSGARDRLELAVRVALGAARMARYGWAHRSVSEALEPAFPLAQACADHEALGSILWGLWVHYQTRTEFPRAHAWLAELEAASAANPDTDLPLIYDMSAGCQWFWEADYPRAIGHTDRLKAAYVQGRHADLTATINHDPLVFSQHWAGSLAEWIRGNPEQSLERMEEAIDLARSIGHPFNLVFALTAGSTSLFYLDLTDRLIARCDEAERTTEEEALGPFAENTLIAQWRGAAHVQQREFETGLKLVKQGNDFWARSEGGICTAMFRSWLALGLAGTGRVAEALEVNRANIAHCRETGDRYMEPECIRLQGEFTLQADPSEAESAERLFREALALAGEHGALSWRLRAAMSFARLLESRERRGEAASVLEPALTALGNGRGSADQEQAAAMLERVG